MKPTGPFFEISTLGDHVFDDVWKVASGVKYWWYKTKKKKGDKLYGPFSSEKMKKWLSKSKIPWNLQISPASSKTQTQPKDLDDMYVVFEREAREFQSIYFFMFQLRD